MDANSIVEHLKVRQSKKFPSVDELASELGLLGRELAELDRQITAMELSGLVMKTKKGRIALPEDLGFHSGKIQLHERGFGFLIHGKQDGQPAQEDVFIPPDKTGNAMNGDTVLVKVETVRYNNREKEEGEVIKIISRNTSTVIGVYEDSPNFGFVVPEDKKVTTDIFIPRGEDLSAKTGDVVVVEITKYPGQNKNAEGKIISVLGRKGEPGVDMLIILAKYNLPKEFPQHVLDFVDRIPETLDPAEAARRRDLTEEVIITIDGADAKDLDDAITVKRLENGNYKLGVHIADVSHYVKENSPVDQEALKRATSVYLIDLVIPMLPQKLSNNLCSLNPNTRKLTLSCEMEIDQNGKIKHSEVFESVIRTSERMTYDDVNAILEKNDEELSKKYETLVPMLKEMEELFVILNRKRMQRGAIDFDFTESYIELNEQGEPVDIRPFVRGVSNRIIEEFMLAANETVAETYYWQKLPFIYRIHEDPDPEKIEAFSESANLMGVSVRFGKDIEPRDLQAILEKVKGTHAEHVLSKLLLRSMMQAKYAPTNLGHFGLAAKYYSHFTSPIRRYPDLEIHRIIKRQLNGEMDALNLERYSEIVKNVSDVSSDMERVAEQAERDVDDMKKAQYMHAHLGEEFEGTISSVTGFGFFVELRNTVEGLVHITTLPPDVEFDDRRMILSSATYGVLRLGDKIRVRVEGVDVDAGDVDFGFLGRIDDEGEFTQRGDVTEDNQPLYLGNFDKTQRARRGAKKGNNQPKSAPASKSQSDSGKGTKEKGTKEKGKGRKPGFLGGKGKSKKTGSRRNRRA